MDAHPTQTDSQTGDHAGGECAFSADRLVSVALDDSWSTLPSEADLIDRWFGTEIAQLFGE